MKVSSRFLAVLSGLCTGTMILYGSWNVFKYTGSEYAFGAYIATVYLWLSERKP